MIDRYTLPEMARVWSRDAKYEAWLRVELAVCEVYARRGLIPADALGRIKARARISADRIEEIERTTRHDVIAFLTNLEESLCVGRTHGIHAEPMSFGLKGALWYTEAGRNLERLRRAREAVRVGKISGAVGTFAHVGPDVEEEVCRLLGLEPAPVSNQIVQRDRHAEYASALAIVAASLEQVALEIRSLQRTEILEAE